MSTTRGRHRTLACSMLVTSVLLASPAQVSAADAGAELSLSRDGRTWTSSLAEPLFDESTRWVPGHSESARFYVRGNGGTPGDLLVDVISSAADPLLASGDLRITARGGGGDWRPVDQPGRHQLLSTPSIADGTVVPVTVMVTFDPAATNLSELRTARLQFRATLTESAPAAAQGPAPMDDRGPSAEGSAKGWAEGRSNALLPATGGPALWLAVVGGLLAGVGAALVSRRGPGHRHGQGVSDV